MAAAPVPLSILDLAAVGREETIAESFAGSVELARTAKLSAATAASGTPSTTTSPRSPPRRPRC